MTGQQLINSPQQVVQESLLGLVATHSHLKLLCTQGSATTKTTKQHNVVVRSDLHTVKQQQITLISGGGSGHEPAHIGYVGHGMLSAAICGSVFTSPDVNTILSTIRACSVPQQRTPHMDNRESSHIGCLLIVKNYTGDRLNFGLAAELARSEGYNVDMVIVGDDCALNETNPDNLFELKRGIAGTCLVHKLLGAYTELNKGKCTLSQVKQFATCVANRISTIGVALSPCIIPGNKSASFTLPSGMVEFGLGIHGEKGAKQTELVSANQIVDSMIEYIEKDFNKDHGTGPAVLLINNLGATTNLELYIVASRAIQVLEEKWGVTVERVFVGAFMTALDMAGVSISVLSLDAENKDLYLSLLDAPNGSIAWPLECSSKLLGDYESRFADENMYHTCEERSYYSIAQDSCESSATSHLVTKNMLQIVASMCKMAIDQEPVLTKMDQEVGDGDMGSSFKRGAETILEALESISSENTTTPTVSQLLHTIGDSVRSMGGSSGVLLSIFFLRMSQAFALAPNTSVDEDLTQLWTVALGKGIEGIQELGGAKSGDKTMLDTLIPVHNFLLQRAQNKDQEDVLRDMVVVGKNAATATKEMVGRKGRAGYLGERARNHVDPGAFAVAILIENMVNTIVQNKLAE